MHHHPGARGGEALGDRGTDPGAGAGDENALVLQILQHRLAFVLSVLSADSIRCESGTC
jgi:hypothetical protein